jgi:hypothetical protein
MSKPLVPLVVVRGGQPWPLGAKFSRSAAYRRHLKSLDRFKRYVDMLQHLEHLVNRLGRVATIDRTRAATQEEWLRRSAEKTQTFFEHVCVVHDFRRGVGYAVRFLNTTTVYGTGGPQEQALARRASHAIGDLLFPPTSRARGPRRLPSVSATVQAIRSDLLREVHEIWRVFDESERRTALLKHIALLGWTLSSSSVPFTIGMRPPTRVTDLVLSQHMGIGQKRLRRAHVRAIAKLIYR